MFVEGEIDNWTSPFLISFFKKNYMNLFKRFRKLANTKISDTKDGMKINDVLNSKACINTKLIQCVYKKTLSIL